MAGEQSSLARLAVANKAKRGQALPVKLLI